MSMLDTPPNGWAALIELIKTLGGLALAVGVPLISWWVSRHTKDQKAQSNRIETLVNGNLHREQEENKRLRALLDANGISADDKT